MLFKFYILRFKKFLVFCRKISYFLTRCQEKSSVRHGRRMDDGSVRLQISIAEHLELPSFWRVVKPGPKLSASAFGWQANEPQKNSICVFTN